jgi:hypothetical protein
VRERKMTRKKKDSSSIGMAQARALLVAIVALSGIFFGHCESVQVVEMGKS